MPGNRAPDGANAELRPPMWAAWAGIGAVAALIGAAAGLYFGLVPDGVDLVHLEWAGSSAEAVWAVHSLGAFRAGVRADLLALIPGTIGLLLACYLGRRVFWTSRAHFLAAVGMAAAVAAGLLTTAQDGLLLIALGDRLLGGWIFRFAEALSLAAFSALLIAVMVAIVALATTIKRLVVAGCGEALSPAGPFTELNKRLAKSPVTTARIKYPAAVSDDEDAVLVFAQAILTPQMPYQLLDFPQDNPGFPSDSTADQWFNAAQFDAYQHLGYIIGAAAARAAEPGTPTGVPPSPELISGSPADGGSPAHSGSPAAGAGGHNGRQ